VLRAGAEGETYPWGDSTRVPRNAGNYADASLGTLEIGWELVHSLDDGRPRLSPVGKFLANRLGVHDLSGNVGEWCQDGYEADYYSRSPRRDPSGPEEPAEGVVRGGSWGSSLDQLRCAARGFLGRAESSNAVGFRTALSLRDAEE